MQTKHKSKNRARGLGVKVLPAMLAMCVGVAQASPGDLNPGFGSGGVVTTPINKANAQAYGITTDKSGRFLVAGRFEKDKTGKSKCTLVRYLPDGSLDTTFGKKGTGIVNSCADDTGESGFETVRVDSKNRIVVAGSSSVDGSGPGVFAVSRYLEDGTLDRHFGTKGVVHTLLTGSDEQSIAFSIVIDSKDQIIAAGASSLSEKPQAGIVRYMENGKLDKSFGTDGIILKSDPDKSVLAFAVALDSTDHLLVAGEKSGLTDELFVSRYSSTGAEDASFGTGGEFSTSLVSGFWANAFTIDSADRPMIGGVEESSEKFTVVRLTTTGSLDATFGAGAGYVTTNIGGLSDSNVLDGLAIDARGRILAGGTLYTAPPPTALQSGVLVRYSPDGLLDTTFGSAGIAFLPGTTSSSYEANAMVLGDDDYATLVGTATTGDEGQLMLVQFNLRD